MRTIMIASLTLLVAGCGQSAEAPANNSAAAEAVGNRLAALSEGQQKAVFLRAIRDAGQDCQQVTHARPGGSYRGMPVWEARCRGGGNWTIVVAVDGTAQILNANEARFVTDQPANSTQGAR